MARDHDRDDATLEKIESAGYLIDNMDDHPENVVSELVEGQQVTIKFRSSDAKECGRSRRDEVVTGSVTKAIDGAAGGVSVLSNGGRLYSVTLVAGAIVSRRRSHSQNKDRVGSDARLVAHDEFRPVACDQNVNGGRWYFVEDEDETDDSGPAIEFSTSVEPETAAEWLSDDGLNAHPTPEGVRINGVGGFRAKGNGYILYDTDGERLTDAPRTIVDYPLASRSW